MAENIKECRNGQNTTWLSYPPKDRNGAERKLPEGYGGICKTTDNKCVQMNGDKVGANVPCPQDAPVQAQPKSKAPFPVDTTNNAIKAFTKNTGININDNKAITQNDLNGLSIAGATPQQKAKAIQEVLGNLSGALKKESNILKVEAAKNDLKDKNLTLAQLVKFSGITIPRELICAALIAVDLQPDDYLTQKLDNKEAEDLPLEKNEEDPEGIVRKEEVKKEVNTMPPGGPATSDQPNVQKIEDINNAKLEDIWDQTIESALGFDPTKVRVAEEEGKMVVYINDRKIEKVDVSNGLNQDEISLIETALRKAGSTEVNEKLIEKIRQGMKLYGVDSDNGISLEDAKKYIETLLKYQKSRRISTLEKAAQAYREAKDFNYEDLDAEVEETKEAEKESRNVLGVNEQTTVEIFINSAENKYNGTAAILKAYIKIKDIKMDSKDPEDIQALIDLLIRLPEASRFSEKIQKEVFEVDGTLSRKFPAKAKYTKENILAYLENRMEKIKMEEVEEEGGETGSVTYEKLAKTLQKLTAKKGNLKELASCYKGLSNAQKKHPDVLKEMYNAFVDKAPAEAIKEYGQKLPEGDRKEFYGRLVQQKANSAQRLMDSDLSEASTELNSLEECIKAMEKDGKEYSSTLYKLKFELAQARARRRDANGDYAAIDSIETSAVIEIAYTDPILRQERKITTQLEAKVVIAKEAGDTKKLAEIANDDKLFAYERALANFYLAQLTSSTNYEERFSYYEKAYNLLNGNTNSTAAQIREFALESMQRIASSRGELWELSHTNISEPTSVTDPKLETLRKTLFKKYEKLAKTPQVANPKTFTVTTYDNRSNIAITTTNAEETQGKDSAGNTYEKIKVGNSDTWVQTKIVTTGKATIVNWKKKPAPTQKQYLYPNSSWKLDKPK